LARVLTILLILCLAGPYPSGPYPDGTTKIFVGIALFEGPPNPLITRLVAVAHMTLPAPVVQLIPLAPVTLTALLVGLIALTSPRLTLLPLDSLVAFLAFAHVPSTGELVSLRIDLDCYEGFTQTPCRAGIMGSAG
jgi:hypothetical protein